jgi:D-alanyl-D-alanine carboxypeptidase
MRSHGLVQQNTGAQPYEFSLATSSGLGINRVTPKAMMKLLRSLRSDLERYKMTFADIMPVAGLDRGTLENRFDTDFSSGSVIGKTGTLGTDLTAEQVHSPVRSIRETASCSS